MFKTPFKKQFLFILIISLICTVFISCNDELSLTQTDTLEFSTDTLSFDTVFTSIGSTTEKILVYNNTDKLITINSIQLAKNTASYFKINVDGKNSANNQFTNIEIDTNDSLYIFVEVKVDPNNSNLPIVIEDAIQFDINNKTQSIQLQAVGQDVEIFRDKYIKNDTILKGAKPYLVYGYLAIDSTKTLTIEKGCRFYFYNNSGLEIYGNLIAQGTFDEPIEMRGHRLDKIKFIHPVPYNYIAGQWNGIRFYSNKGQHELQNIIIRSATYGIYLTNKSTSDIPKIKLKNSKIHNHLYNCIKVENTDITVENSEISNSGSNCIYLSGGKHQFFQSTIANYYNGNPFSPSARDQGASVLITELSENAPSQTTFINCIIAGTLPNELQLASQSPTSMNADFAYNYITRSEPYPYSFFSNIRWSQTNDTLFESTSYDNILNTYFCFSPHINSPVRNIGSITTANHYPLDLNGNNRLEDGKPDLGAYEFK